MKILYLVNMQENNGGGLFKATYERIVRHANVYDTYIINLNTFEDSLIKFIKSKMFSKKIYVKQNAYFDVDGLRIHNLNKEIHLNYYWNKIIKKQKTNINDTLNLIVNKFGEIISTSNIIHAHWGRNAYIAYELSNKYNIPYFLTFHGSDINRIKKSEIHFLIEAMENANKCFFVSKQLLKNAMKLGYSGLNAEITYNGVDIKKFNIVGKPTKSINVVGYIGDLKTIKGADLLPEIFIEINKLEESTNFIIVGDGYLKKEIMNKLKQIKEKVRYTGYIAFDKIPNILEKIDVLIVPSREEGLGMIILEANAMGIPVVGTNIGGIPEAIGDSKNLIEWDEKFISNMVNRVGEILRGGLEDEQYYRRRIIDKFLWEDIVKIERKNYEKVTFNKNNYY